LGKDSKHFWVHNGSGSAVADGAQGHEDLTPSTQIHWPEVRQ